MTGMVSMLIPDVLLQVIIFVYAWQKFSTQTFLLKTFLTNSHILSKGIFK